MEAKIAKLSKELYENQSSLNPELFGDGDDDLFRYISSLWTNLNTVVANHTVANV